MKIETIEYVANAHGMSLDTYLLKRIERKFTEIDRSLTEINRSLTVIDRNLIKIDRNLTEKEVYNDNTNNSSR